MRRLAAVANLRHAILATALLWSACVASAPRPVPAPAPPAPAVSQTPVRAVLFGYIPDAANDHFAALIRQLSQHFQAASPQASAQITIDPDLDLYDLKPGGVLETLFGTGPKAADVVEIDSLLLGALVERGWLQPPSIQIPRILPAALEAASVAGVAYGVPTYLCSNVIYAHTSDLGSAGDGAALLRLLSSLSPSKPALVGNYRGSWILPSAYLDAWADTNGTAGLAGAYLPPVEPRAMGSFRQLVRSCASGAVNPCLDGTYATGTQAETAFATREANGFVGFTERLFYILSAVPRPLPSVISAPLGLGSRPVMFVDLLVVSRHCTQSCLANATAFIRFMSQLSTRNLIAFSQDAPPGAIPRYLLQANSSFYSGPLAQADPFYPQYWRFIQGAVPYPNQGFPEDRLLLGPAVKDALAAAPAAEEHRPAAGDVSRTRLGILDRQLRVPGQPGPLLSPALPPTPP